MLPSLKFWAAFLLSIFFGAIFLILIVTETTLMLLLMPVLIALLLGLPIRYFGERAAHNRGLKTHKADSDEIQREDDVLLQSVAFSQSILFVMINFLFDDVQNKLFWGVLIAVCAVTFYVLRALGKVKDSPRYRFYSMLALSFVIANTVLLLPMIRAYYLVVLFSTSVWSFFLSLSFLFAAIVVYGAITDVFLEIARNVSRKRYGYN